MREDFGASDVHRICGITPDVLRDWRRRGFLDTCGTQSEGGHWRYSKGDVFTLAVARRLAFTKAVSDLPRAISLARSVLPWVVAEFRGEVGTPWTHQFLIAQGEYNVAVGSDDFEVRPIGHVSNLPDILEESPSALNIIIDAHRIAREFRGAISVDDIKALSSEGVA